ncbi:hypothetical protein [Novosphingobium gossypii]|uniref:hypothetical protein n=1 Tax=Novosphingobium gossypii TaxID=1604774 RepID=UPI003D1E5FD2
MSNWTEVQIVTLVAGSSVFAAVVTQGVSVIRDGLKRGEDRTFARLYASTALEAYANALSMAVSDSSNYDVSEGEVGEAIINIPEFPPFSTDIDWRALGAATTKQLLAFPVEVDRLRAELSFEWDVIGDPDVTAPKVREYAAWVGLRALHLAAGLNAEFTADPYELSDGSWNLEDNLKREFESHRDARLAQERANQDFVLSIANEHEPAEVSDMPEAQA